MSSSNSQLPIKKSLEYVTIHNFVDAEPEGDTFFPALPSADWKQVGTIAHATDDRHAYAFAIETWDRVR